MHPKGADSMAISGLHFRNALVAWLWVGHCYPLMHERVGKIVLSPCTVPISGGEAFIPVWASVCQLSAVTSSSSLMGGCGLSHKHVEDGCKSTCVKFGAENPTELGIR